MATAHVGPLGTQYSVSAPFHSKLGLGGAGPSNVRPGGESGTISDRFSLHFVRERTSNVEGLNIRVDVRSETKITRAVTLRAPPAAFTVLEKYWEGPCSTGYKCDSPQYGCPHRTTTHSSSALIFSTPNGRKMPHCGDQETRCPKEFLPKRLWCL